MTEVALAPVQSAALAPIGQAAGAGAIEALIIQGDLAKITPAQRVAYYRGVCESLGLNPFTQPFGYINLDGKLTLYPKKDATDQLRQSRGVTILDVQTLPEDASGITTSTAHGRDIHGREDWATGAVFTKGLGGQNLANARMKAETKAKRRLTLSLVGLGWLDESEIEAARAVRVVVNMDTGEIDEADAARLAAVPTASERLAKRRALLESTTASHDSAADATPSGEGERVTAPPSAAESIDSDVVEGLATEVTEQPDAQAEPDEAPAGLTWVQFRSRMGAANLTTQKVKAAAAALWPDRQLSALPSEWELDPSDWAALAAHMQI